MVSIEAGGGHAPQLSLGDVVDWGRVVVGTLARAVVVVLLGLALWSAAPAAIGWKPTTVMSGSMEPRLHPGDVVVSRPVAAAQIREGRVLLADDPDQHGHLRMHRYVDEGPARTIITKGDANPQADSTPLRRSAVHGVGYLRIPYVAAPVLWLRTGEWARLAVAALGFVVLLALCAVDGPLRRVPACASSPDGDGDDDRSGSDGGRGGREARHRAVASLPSDGRGDRRRPTRRTLGRARRRGRRLHRSGIGAALIGVVAVGGAVPAPAVAVGWSAATTSPRPQFTAVAGTAISGLTCSTASGSAQLTWTFPSTAAEPTRFEVVANGTTVIRQVAGTVRTAPAAGQLLSLGPSTITIRAVYADQTGWSALGQSSVRVNAVTSILTSCVS
jgi:signal peptidase